LFKYPNFIYIVQIVQSRNKQENNVRQTIKYETNSDVKQNTMVSGYSSIQSVLIQFSSMCGVHQFWN